MTKPEPEITERPTLHAIENDPGPPEHDENEPDPTLPPEAFGEEAWPDVPPEEEGELAAGGGNTDRPGAAPRLKVLTARELCKLPDPDRSDEVLGPLLIRRERTVLGGAKNEGKTSLGLQMVAAVVTGGEFLGFTGAGGRALVIDAEQGLRTVKRRLAEVGLADSDAVDYLRVPDGLALDSDKSEIAEIEATLKSGGYSLVYAEPLYKLHRGESKDDRHAIDVMRRFDGWRERYGFALGLAMHLRKRQPGSGRFTLDEFFGSAAYTWGAEIVLGIRRLNPGAAALHFFGDRDGDLPLGEHWRLLFDRDDGGFRRDPDDGKTQPTTPEQLREALRAEPGMTEEQMVKVTGKAERTVRDALKSIGAVNDGGRPKRWRLPAGEQEGLL